MINSIVVGTDGSVTAKRALEKAAGLAEAFGARIHLVSAYEPGVSVSGAGVEGDVGPGAAVDAITEQAVGALRVKGIEVAVYARKGDPAEAILNVAEEQSADLIIIGNKGMRGAKRFLLGSVPNKISHHAPCDVMIVRTT